jgi:hypothetical protein
LQDLTDRNELPIVAAVRGAGGKRTRLAVVISVVRGLCGFAGYVVGRGGAAVDGVGKPGAVGIIRAR